jgi:hypothetical protein
LVGRLEIEGDVHNDPHRRGDRQATAFVVLA